jgi:hypothetical protein
MLKVAALLLIVVCSACADTCNNEVQRAVDAPDGARTAILFQRDCGATTDFSTQVSIVQPGDKPSGGGNVFVADTNRDAAERAAWGGPWAEVTWLTPQHLLVRYNGRARVFKRVGEMSAVRVSFEKVAR